MLSPQVIIICPSLPCDWSLPASKKHNQEEKKAHIPLRTSWILKQMCQPCLVIIQSCYFDYRINKPFAYSRRVICVSCSLDRDVRRSQRIIGFYLNYPQISEVGNSEQMVVNGFLFSFIAPCTLLSDCSVFLLSVSFNLFAGTKHLESRWIGLVERVPNCPLL